MITYHITLNKELAQMVERKIKEDKYANKSEFFRSVLRKVLIQDVQDNCAGIERIEKSSDEYKELLTLSKQKNSRMAYSKFLKTLE